VDGDAADSFTNDLDLAGKAPSGTSPERRSSSVSV
jgi:hypothetical protein